MILCSVPACINEAATVCHFCSLRICLDHAHECYPLAWTCEKCAAITRTFVNITPRNWRD